MDGASIESLVRRISAKLSEAAGDRGCNRRHPITRLNLDRRDNFLNGRSEEHTSELQSQSNLVCRLLLEKKKIIDDNPFPETPNYVKRILGTAEDYSRLYSGDEAVSANTFRHPWCHRDPPQCNTQGSLPR